MLQRLQSAFSRVTEFTADASHELRTPVAVIQTTAELMQSRPRSVDEHLEAWSRVHAETQRTAQLIGDLLLLARSDAGKTELEFTAIDLAEVTRTAAEEMRVIAEAKGLTFSLDASQPCPIKGDAEALRQVLCILLDNAIKFTPAPGSVSISASHATVTISDTGIGIPANEIPKIFDRFYRVSKDRSRATGGAGLGLSIANWIITRHHGQIQVTSTPNQGSAFSIHLPLQPLHHS
jgi:signal transduction histidine kinase